MIFFLKIKHWQLFLLTWGMPLLIVMYSVVDPVISFRLFPVMLMVFTIGFYGWMWAIVTVLRKQLPSDVQISYSHFRLLLIIPVVYFIALILSMNYEIFYGAMGYGEQVSFSLIGIILGLHFLSMICIIMALRYSSKTMKSVELGRRARFSDYVTEFFLIWFSPVGMWVLQPRLNALVNKSENPR
jgi:hypothetical protein